MPVPTRIRIGLRTAIGRLARFYGPPGRPPAADPFALVIWENCAYLVDDEQRAAVFKRLKRSVGLDPAAILATPVPALADIIEQGGMLPLRRAEKLHTAAEIALDIGRAELRRTIKRSPREARKLLRRFPGIGQPGADKILLFCRGDRTLAPDSNALRVLVRLGYGTETDDYQRQYRSAREAVASDLPADFSLLIKGHQLLRHHGQTLCKRAAPRCDACPLAPECCWNLDHT
jgi:endonuclease III